MQSVSKMADCIFFGNFYKRLDTIYKIVGINYKPIYKIVG